MPSIPPLPRRLLAEVLGSAFLATFVYAASVVVPQEREHTVLRADETTIEPVTTR
jgi:hypothetical protein